MPCRLSFWYYEKEYNISANALLGIIIISSIDFTMEENDRSASLMLRYMMSHFLMTSIRKFIWRMMTDIINIFRFPSRLGSEEFSGVMKRLTNFKIMTLCTMGQFEKHKDVNRTCFYNTVAAKRDLLHCCVVFRCSPACSAFYSCIWYVSQFQASINALLPTLFL